MTRGKNKRSVQEIKELIAGEEDILRPLIGAVLQEVLEAEMSQALGAEKGERIGPAGLSRLLLRAQSGVPPAGKSSF
jgi:transposase-like protein